MCGICGIIDYNSQGKIGDEALRRMCSRLKHRGPDDEGIYLSDSAAPYAGLGHRRLSIIDLSDAGHQPMSNEDGTIQVILNGEIYNYKELRIGLEEKGHRFKSNTDTETILHLYEDHGIDCVKELDGMFAFAIWDERKKMLLLARDRFGKKPLLYYHQGGRFCFASEFSALLECGFIKKEIDYGALREYFTFGYISAPLTIYKHVFKVMPAHLCVLKGGNLKHEPYWCLDYAPKNRITEEEAKEEVLRLLKDAVRKRLYSDVPLGAFLSGGIDSSAIVALMSELNTGKVKTFSIGFEESVYNELSHARIVAARYRTEHTEFTVKPDEVELLPKLAEHYGEPYADSSCIPTYYVSRLSRQYVTVALNGDGGDESFGGYERYAAMLLAEKLKSIPALARKSLGFLTNMLPAEEEPKNPLKRLKKFVSGIELPFIERYLNWMSIFTDVQKSALFSERMKEEGALGRGRGIQPGPYGLTLDTLLSMDISAYLPNDLLVKADIASMANSLELRSPFLDYKLAEFVARLPAEYKIKGSTLKYILKKALKGILPPENINRRKMGFGVPVSGWLRGGLREFVCDILLSPESCRRGYFNQAFVEDMIKNHIDSKQEHSYRLWSLLMFELWHRKFMD
ncbi:MAG: asparagine synthase (glutamine-hydrolyzing) [Candidatus Omnitrophota bacterium]